jgi:predicted GIY-YIG superfamily endonuclease
MTPKVCILNEDDDQSLIYGGIAHKCSSRRHHHYLKSKADALVKEGELVWLGKHKKVATFCNARSWIKTYQRNQYGEVITCGMQLVRGGGGF